MNCEHCEREKRDSMRVEEKGRTAEMFSSFVFWPFLSLWDTNMFVGTKKESEKRKRGNM